MAVNLRPQSETIYTIQPSDAGAFVVGTNPLAQMAWTLPTGIADVILRNGSTRQMLMVTLPDGSMDGFSTLALQPSQAVRCDWDGSGYQTLVGLSGHSTRLGSVVNLVGVGSATLPIWVAFFGTVTPGDVFGFDYHVTLDGVPKILQFRHTMAAGDTLKSAVQDLLNRFNANPDVISFVGRDLIAFGAGGEPGPYQGGWQIGWDQSWPNAQTNPSITFYASPNATITAQTGGGGIGLEASSYIVVGTTTRGIGPPPVPGQVLWQMYVVGDTTARAAPIHDANPWYGLVSFFIKDPTDGAQKGSMQIWVDEAQLLGTLRTVALGANLAPLGSATMAQFQNLDDVPTDVEINSFASQANVAFPRILYRAAGGSSLRPSGVKKGQLVGTLTARPHDGTGYAGNSGAFHMDATEDHAPGRHGVSATMMATPVGSTTAVDVIKSADDDCTAMAQIGFGVGTQKGITRNVVIGAVTLNIVGGVIVGAH